MVDALARPQMPRHGLDFSTSDVPTDGTLRAIDEGFDEHNFAAAPLGDVSPLAAFAIAPSGAVVGGAVGRTWGRCCKLLQHRVAPEHRAGGVGSRRLAEFEAHARARGRNMFYLTTPSFHAPAFYRKHGYAEPARIAGCPEGVVTFLMQKAVA